MTIVDDFRILEKNGFELLPYFLAKNEKEAVAAAKKIKYPVVLKVVSSEIEHKTDVGGVKVGISNEDILRHSYQDIMKNTKGKKVDGILVQKMARKGVELIVGGKRDPQFGHMIVLGLGGIYVEIFKDVSARICPLGQNEIQEMISELKSHPIIDGARGRKPINKKAIIELVIKTCSFMEKENLGELDLNPVVCDDRGCDIVDARFSR
ncbi:acetate--CoA ligase family protein [Candidatus Micrarchaeota archaeon]|nr:acetate--CoA ligase family protein [Candidatus Micrarchaeota archaeon]MBU1681340.1 acetate--CoA ligase family protein [Candidatus Micrarchaeota archaeon]